MKFQGVLQTIIGFLVLFGGYQVYSNYDSNSVTIANWNLQIFGPTKAANLNLMNSYGEIISKYDIVFVQEIRDSDGGAFQSLCLMLEDYDCLNSSRAGRSLTKEQYGIIYRKGIEIIEVEDFNPDELDRWERPPIKVVFDLNGTTLSVYNIHTKPADVQSELSYLEGIVENSGNVLVFGDLNADCRYYSAENEIEFDSWNWLIQDDEDTSVSATDCAYDRILLNEDAYEEYLDSGIFKSGIDESLSDHYVIWVKMRV